MNFGGLLVEVDEFNFFEVPHDDDGKLGGLMIISFDFDVDDQVATSCITLAYFRSGSTPLATLTTTLKFRVDNTGKSKQAAQTMLFAVKSQNSFMVFMLYQQLTERSVQNIKLHPNVDQTLYQMIAHAVDIATLHFDEEGQYDFPFS